MIQQHTTLWIQRTTELVTVLDNLLGRLVYASENLDSGWTKDPRIASRLRERR